MNHLQNHIVQFCKMIHITINMYICRLIELSAYHYIALILDNICILLLNNILNYTLVHEIDTMENPWY